ncbi:MAG TPA: S9 family peptidase [Hyphomicrobiaceae bacterium]|nr:S9 family peptidase [Hyphomicrobiaceae bacterium]
MVLPTLIPRAKLFSNPARTLPQISADGHLLAWLSPVEGVLNIWVAPIDDPGAARQLTRRTGRPVMHYDWLPNGRQIAYVSDDNGDENLYVVLVDVATGSERIVTPRTGVAASVAMASPDRPDAMLVLLNERDKRWHDAVEIDLATGAQRIVFENTLGLSSMSFDWQHRCRLGVRQIGGGRQELLRLDGARPEVLFEIPQPDAFSTGPGGFNRNGDHWYLHSSIGRDRSALFRVDALSNRQTLLAEHDTADISGLIADPLTFDVIAACADPIRREWMALTDAARADLAILKAALPGLELSVVSQSNVGRWVIGSYAGDQPMVYHLYDRTERTVTKLFGVRPELEAYSLAPTHGQIIKSRDGLDLVCYLTLPASETGERPKAPLPMVLHVHGGPWHRDYYGYNRDNQWLANRGYAVLAVNYRASTGFGKAFINAGDKEHAGKMHDDLIDAVDWAVREGIARRDKVAIMGASYGGYATLVGLTFTPDVFCCGVSVVGISNLVTMLENIPPYWEGFNEQMFGRYADPRTEEGRAWLRSRSPLSRIDRISKPLLLGHGANDVRCKQMESDQIVDAMTARGLPATYVVYTDEGHGFYRPENNMSFNAITEAFLARHLGGRMEPIGSDLDGSSLIVPTGAESIEGLIDKLPPERRLRQAS